MKLTDVIAINRVGLETITDTVQRHLLDFAYSCNIDMEREWEERGEYSFELIDASTVALNTLRKGNDIEAWIWDVIIEIMEEREWQLVEDMEEEQYMFSDETVDQAYERLENGTVELSGVGTYHLMKAIEIGLEFIPSGTEQSSNLQYWTGTLLHEISRLTGHEILGSIEDSGLLS